MGKYVIRILSLGLCLCLTAGMTLAEKGKAKDKPKKIRHGASDKNTHVGVDVAVIISQDRETIREYVKAIPAGNLPPGLVKRGGALPPGLEKHLRRNGTLPPGLQKKLHPFPAELEHPLSALPPDLGRAFVSGRVILYNKKTSAILDIFVPLE